MQEIFCFFLIPTEPKRPIYTSGVQLKIDWYLFSSGLKVRPAERSSRWQRGGEQMARRDEEPGKEKAKTGGWGEKTMCV